MMISDRQAHLALEYLRRTQVDRRVRRASDQADISPELFERVMVAVSQAPDVRYDRIEAAGEVVEGRVPAAAVAEKMIGRLISDDLV